MARFKASSQKPAKIFMNEEVCDKTVIALNKESDYNWFKMPVLSGFIIISIMFGVQTNLNEFHGEI